MTKQTTIVVIGSLRVKLKKKNYFVEVMLLTGYYVNYFNGNRKKIMLTV